MVVHVLDFDVVVIFLVLRQMGTDKVTINIT